MSLRFRASRLPAAVPARRLSTTPLRLYNPSATRANPTGQPMQPVRLSAPKNFALSLLLVFGAATMGYVAHDTLQRHTIVQTQAQEIGTLQPKFGSKADYLACIKDLEDLWEKKGKRDSVSTDDDDLRTHGISDWSYHEEHRPTVVVWVDSCVVSQPE